MAACLEYLFEYCMDEIEQECLEDELLAAMWVWCSSPLGNPKKSTL